MQYYLTATTAVTRARCVLSNACRFALELCRTSRQCIAYMILRFLKGSSVTRDVALLSDEMHDEEFNNLLALELDAD